MRPRSEQVRLSRRMFLPGPWCWVCLRDRSQQTKSNPETSMSTQPIIKTTSQRLDVQEFPGWPCFGQDEIEAVTAVLGSGKVNYWTGNEGRRFEDEFASSVGCKFA